MGRPPTLKNPEDILIGLRVGEVGVWRWKIDSEELIWTDNLEGVHSLPAGTYDGTLSSFRCDLHPDDVEKVWHAITKSIQTNCPYRVVYRTATKESEPAKWIEAAGGAVHGDDGHRYLTGVCFDVTGRVQIEKELMRRLQQQQSIERFSSFSLGEQDLQKILGQAVETAAEVFDVPLTKILEFSDDADGLVLQAGLGWRKGLVGSAKVGTEAQSQAGYTLLSKTPVVVRDLLSETRFNGPQLLLDHRVRSGMSVVIAGSAERPFGVFGIHSDQLRDFDSHDVDCLISLANIVANSARHHAAFQQQKFLLREMAHRSGNLLQVVNSLATQTFRNRADPQLALTSFLNRVEALSRANHLIARGGWAPTRFISLLEETLEAFSGRIEFIGRDILLPADLSFDLGLVVHELATNSAKYGSLSSDKGKIELRWHISNDDEEQKKLRLVWEDHGAVSRSASPGTGFGSKLKRLLIEKKWHGAMTVEFNPGYRFTCEVPFKP